MSKPHKESFKRRYTSSERIKRITDRIQKAGRRGLTQKQIARHEHLSRNRTNYYLRQILGKQRKKDPQIGRLDKKYYYVELKRKKITPKPEPQRIQKKPLVELRGYINYASSSFSSRDIDIDCVIIVQHDNAAIVAGSRRIKDIVETTFGRKLAAMLKFGISETTPQSSHHFFYRRHGGNWNAFHQRDHA